VIGESTGAIVKVHRSNFEIRGFVAEADVSELSSLARTHALPLLFDFGSGLLLHSMSSASMASQRRVTPFGMARLSS
jgi:seryl-tRNA(Sec) selenium transferase